MIEIFKTNVQEAKIANNIIAQLLEHLPNAKINFDLEDCDKILRVEDLFGIVDTEWIIKTINSLGYQCEILE